MWTMTRKPACFVINIKYRELMRDQAFWPYVHQLSYPDIGTASNSCIRDSLSSHASKSAPPGATTPRQVTANAPKTPIILPDSTSGVEHRQQALDTKGVGCNSSVPNVYPKKEKKERPYTKIKPKRRPMQRQTAYACRLFFPLRRLKRCKQSLCILETRCDLGILIMPDNAVLKERMRFYLHSIEIVVNRKERERSASNAVLA
ncbi:hypothetical protein F4801DRAFT_288921 [Xylaria longipes]|nr:hypothetical protein F4801DRAFT_288921 [Xylaria longipes]